MSKKPENKIDIARRLYRDGDFKKALIISVDFKSRFSKDEINLIKIAQECFNGRRSFYEELMIDVDSHIAKCIELFETKIMKNANC